MRATSRLPALLLASLAFGQEETVLEYGVPTPDEVHLDAYKDFRQFVAQADWSRALRSIDEQLEEPPAGLLASADGVHLSYSERLWRDLAGLPRDGRRAFRLYYDPKAKRAWGRAAEEPDADARAALWREVFTRYFPSSYGDQAADALARAAVAAGKPGEAVAYWGALLEYHRDTDLDRLSIALDQCAALAAAGRAGSLAEHTEALNLRYAGEQVTWAGQTWPIEEALASLVDAGAVAQTPSLGARLELAARPEAAWRLGVDTWEANNNRGGFWVANEGAAQPPIPAAVIVGDDLIFDHAGLVKRFSAATGDEQWTSGGHPNDVAPSQLQGRLFAERIGERLLVAGDVHHAGAGPAVHLVCFDLIGRELWSTRKDRDFQGLSVIGVPSHADGTVYAVMQREGTYNLDLVAVSLADGARLWTAPLGTPVSAAASNPWMWMGSGAVLPIAPQVVLTGDEILVVTDSCAVLAVDPVAGRIRWAYTRPVERRFDDGPSPGSSVYLDGILYLRSQGNKNCFALDVAKREELWTSRVHQSERIVASDEQHLYLLGDNLRAIHLRTGERVWSRPIQVARDTRHIVETEEYLYVLTRRGLFEVDKATGDNARTPLRGAMSKMGGGDLFLVAGHLVCVGRSEVLAVTLGT